MTEVSHLVKEFSNDEKVFRAVDDVSFQMQRGEIYGIISLSGTGKPALVRCLNRLEEPTSGKIFINGVDMVALNKEESLNQRKGIGMIFRHFNLFLQKTVYDNIACPLETQKWPKEEIQARVEELLDFIDLKDKREVYPSSLSGGQRQRVAMARALTTSPKILLSDEGTSALGPINIRMVVEILKKTVKDLNTTIIMITHQMEVAKDICDRTVVMENGKIIEENTVEGLLRAPKTKQTQNFISSLRKSDDLNQNPDPTKYKGRVLRLSYDDHTVDQPILSCCIKGYQMDVNLPSGNMNRLDVKDFGYVIVEVLGPDQQVDQALAFMKEVGVYVEVLK